ncbi:hypothetical protein DGG96_00440 [Legionella qingyii]|uniref:Uncharacterized protein n=1 Tax=Legionella qingyii TaxID=2184757 RepID=A0A317UAN0_9GAMM|nr:hypothetical protein [Legionella qingyii]PWY57602.1 hypothetical protein DGG96_00440 [Legionella qingyii]RUR25932.1 hypothetical protein ELY20_01950 [Legionella qingyii]RUR29321.1 hypothetical protein ELY16_00575 [Legionella qingyii]
MWYLRVMRELLKTLPERDQTDGKDFLIELFRSVKKLWGLPEIEFFLGLIEKSFLKFENQEPGSVSLTEFSRHILGLTLLYIKSSDELAIWNSDFIPKMNKMERFLAIKKRTSMIKFLNQLEMNAFASLEHKLNINFTHLRSIISKCTALEQSENGSSTIAQFFAYAYANELDRENCCDAFKLIIQDAMTHIESQNNETLQQIFPSKSQLRLFKSIAAYSTASESKSEYMKKR